MKENSKLITIGASEFETLTQGEFELVQSYLQSEDIINVSLLSFLNLHIKGNEQTLNYIND